MGFAVNASTIGMAAASLLVAAFANRIKRAAGIWISLALLSIPTALLGVTQDLTTFTILRVLQGVFMSTAFTLTLTHLSERCTLTAIGGAMAAYITGNVASNLFGRLLASGLADNFGLAESFYAFSVLNLAGALIAFLYFKDGPPLSSSTPAASSVFAAWRTHLGNPRLRAAFGIGFIMLFVFVGVFSYVNFVIAEPPFALPQMYIGLVYLVFVPAILTTPVASAVTRRHGARPTFLATMAVTLVGLMLLATSSLALMLLGLTLVGAALFFGQSVATAFVGRSAQHDHAAANGLYLASYYIGGIAGALILGQIFVAFGWTAAVAVLSGLIVIAALLGLKFHEDAPE